MGFLLDAEATRSTLLSVDTTLSANIDATQDYIPVTSTAGFSTSVVAEIETTNEVVSFADISSNQYLNSEAVNSWINSNMLITQDATAAPNGTITADKCVPSTANALHFVYQNSITVTGPLTYSVFAKASGYNFIKLFSGGSSICSANFNLATGAVGTTGGSGFNSARITDFGNGWYRCEITSNTSVSGATTAGGVYVTSVESSPVTSGFTEAGDGTSGAFLWGAQIEQGTTASTYLPTTTTALQGLTTVTRGVNGTTAASATSGDAIQQLPFSFQGVTENGSSTLSENIDASQDYIPVASTSGFATGVDATIESTNEVVSFADISSNLILYSQTYSNAYWTKSASTVTANATTAPDGTTTASKLNETAATTQFRVMRDSLVSGSAANKTFTWSCSFKKAERTAVRIEIYADTQAVESTAMFDLSNGTVGYTANVDSTAITSQGDDWYRCSLTRTMGATASALRVYHMPSTGTSHGDQIYAGNPSNGIYLWGSQLEEASSPSTYLPTTTTALVGLTGVTRGVNGTTAASALSGATISQAPSLTSIGMSLRLRALSVSSDGTGAGRLTLCNNNGDTLCDVDIPDDRVYTLEFGGGIVFPNGIFISNTDNITSYTLYTDKFSGNRLTAGA